MPAVLFGQAPAIVVPDRVRPDTPSGLQMGDVSADDTESIELTDDEQKLAIALNL